MIHAIPMCVHMCVCLCVYSSVLYLNHSQSLLDIVSEPLSSGLPLQAQLMFLSNGCLSPLQQGFPLAFWKLGEESEGERRERGEGGREGERGGREGGREGREGGRERGERGREGRKGEGHSTVMMHAAVAVQT